MKLSLYAAHAMVLAVCTLVLSTAANSEPIIVDLKRCTITGANELSFSAFNSSDANFSFTGNLADSAHELSQYFVNSGLGYLVEKEFGLNADESGMYRSTIHNSAEEASVQLGYHTEPSPDLTMTAFLSMKIDEMEIIPDIKTGMPETYFRRIFSEEIDSYRGPSPYANYIYLNFCGKFPGVVSLGQPGEVIVVYKEIGLLLGYPDFGKGRSQGNITVETPTASTIVQQRRETTSSSTSIRWRVTSKIPSDYGFSYFVDCGNGRNTTLEYSPNLEPQGYFADLGATFATLDEAARYKCSR